MKIVNRQGELKSLDKHFKTSSSQFFVIWGRRRVGKTYLIKYFSQKKPTVYYLATKSNEKEQLREISLAISEYFKDEFLKIRGFGNWLDLFRYLKNKVKHRFVLAIDEYSYLISTNPAISSIFQKGWDEYLKNSKIFLILSGSSISMMENNVLSAKSPLYGRRTGQLRIEPLNFNCLRKFFPKANLEKIVEIYSICGGIPFYLNLLDNNKTVFNNIKEKILNKSEILYEEIDFLLKEEFREPKTYFPILQAIAQGNRKFGHIANYVGQDKANLTKYLSILENLKIIKREIPITEKWPEKSKKGLYKISDQFTNFWFRFIYPNKRFVEMQKEDYVLKHKIMPFFNQYVSIIFEDIFYQLFEELNVLRKLPFEFTKIGRYWDSEIEVDLMAFDDLEKNIYFGEIKWQNQKMTMLDYKKLYRKWEIFSKKFKEFKNVYFVLANKNGFDSKLIAKKSKQLLLIDLNQF